MLIKKKVVSTQRRVKLDPHFHLEEKWIKDLNLKPQTLNPGGEGTRNAIPGGG